MGVSIRLRVLEGAWIQLVEIIAAPGHVFVTVRP